MTSRKKKTSRKGKKKTSRKATRKNGKYHMGDHRPRPHKDPIDEESELIGTILWCDFQQVVLAKNVANPPTKAKSIGREAIKAGRYNSRGWIYENLRLDLVP